MAQELIGEIENLLIGKDERKLTITYDSIIQKVQISIFTPGEEKADLIFTVGQGSASLLGKECCCCRVVPLDNEVVIFINA